MGKKAAAKKERKREPRPGEGRPTKYKPESLCWIEKLCKLGATDEELAEFLEVAVSTIYKWKAEDPEFSEAIKRGKQYADATVAERLYQRAIGYEHDAEELKVVSTGGGSGSAVERVQVRKIYPPDTTAGIFWLKNRKSKTWRDRQEHDVTFNNVEPIVGMIIEESKHKPKK